MSINRPASIVVAATLLCGLVFGLINGAFASRSAIATAAVIRSERPAVDVMFVLDTTSSMTGLIAAAKDKIWSIANTLASADPAPEIRMGLVGYRDRGDAYVTVFMPLTDDLDAVYARLMQFEAVGGGDTPESVNQALYEAVSRPDWHSGESVYRVIFLVGDAPPQMTYPDDIKYPHSCTLAAGKDIVINTIQCGSMAGTMPVWQEIAQRGNGDYFQVAQSGGAVLYDTPYDEAIADLSRSLDATRIYFGDADHLREMEDRRKTADAIYRSAKPAAVAKRTIFNSTVAGVKNFTGSQELVAAVESGELLLSDVPKAHLPADLQGMEAPQLAAHVEARSKERKRLQARVEDLGNKRQHYIEAQVRKATDAGAASLDSKLYRCIQSQAAGKGIVYSGGPAY